MCVIFNIEFCFGYLYWNFANVFLIRKFSYLPKNCVLSFEVLSLYINERFKSRKCKRREENEMKK